MPACTISVPIHHGKSFGAYVSMPPTGRGPGLVVIQEIWGVNEHIRTVADQYALDGFVVLAPDVYWREQPGVDLQYTEADTRLARQHKQKLDIQQAAQDLAAAAQVLRARADVTGPVASVGFCMGGLLSYALAATGAVDAAVCYYGGGIENHLALAASIHVPTLFHYAEQDDHISSDEVASVQAAFAGCRYAQFHVYPAVQHGFNCWGRPMYNQRAAALAHGRTLQWLAERML
jgi:carboxymethylenebutenolidase